MLKEAGVEGFSAELMARNCCFYPDDAAVVAEQLREFLGLDIKLNVVEPSAGFTAFDNGDYDFAVQATAMLFYDPDAAIINHVTAGDQVTPRYTGLVHPKVEELYEQQKRSLDLEERRALTQEMEDYLLNVDMAYLGLYWGVRYWPVHNNIHGFNIPGSGYAHKKHEDIWCDPACK